MKTTRPAATTRLMYLLAFLLAPVIAVAQPRLSVFNVDATNHPTVSASFHALDASGQPISGLTAADFRVLEDGLNAPVTLVQCPETTAHQSASVAVSIDISNSMNSSDLSDLPINLAKSSASVLANALPLPPCEIALQTCNETALINQDFTTDRNQFLSMLSAVKAGGGNNFVEHLLNIRTGLLNVAKTGSHRRAAIIMTDAYWDRMSAAEVQRCIDTCKAYDIRFYAIVFSRAGVMPGGITSSLRQIAQATGGRLLDGAVTNQIARQLVMELLGEIQGVEPCTIEWKGLPGCRADRVAVVEIPVLGLRDSVSYTITKFDPAAVVSIDVTPSTIAFGPVAPGKTRDTVVTLTAKNGTVVVRSITSNNPQMTVEANGAPPMFTLLPGESRTLTIRYSAIDSAMSFARFAVESNACIGDAFYVTAGFYRNDPVQLQLNAPNGGEIFSVGDTAALTWTGVLPDEPVRLEYSIDAGATWQTIVDKATGLRQLWKVPNTPSVRCLARVTQSMSDGPVLTLGGTEYVQDVAFSSDGRRVGVVTRAHTDIYDVYTGATTLTIYNHPLMEAMAYSPDGRTIATGGGDGTIRIWNAATGARLQILGGFGFPIHAVRFSPDGREILSAANSSATQGDNTVILWDIASNGILRQLPPSSFDGSGWFSAVDFSSDGQYACSGGSNGRLTVYDPWTGNIIESKNHGAPVSAVRFSPDGSEMASSSAGVGGVKFWRFGDPTPVRSFTADAVYDMAYMPDGKSFIMSNARVVEHRELYTGSLLRTFSGAFDDVTCLDISRDGRFLAAGSKDGSARIWDLDQRPLQSDVSDSLWAIAVSTVAGTSVDFGTVLVGEYKDSTITAFVHNIGSVVAHVQNIRFVGADAGNFVLIAGDAPFDIAPGDSAAIELRFKPLTVGRKSAIVEVRTQSQLIQQGLVGTGIEPELQVAESLIDFGKVGVGDRKDSTINVVLTNLSSRAISIASTALNGPDLDQFTIILGGGAFTLQAGESRSMTLRFAPARIGRTSGSIAFVHNGAGGIAVVQLFGEGVAGSSPAINAVTALDAPPVACQTIESTMQLDVENIGGSTLDIDSITISGVDAASFALNPPFSGATVLPGETTTLVIAFTPTHWGLHTATATIASNASNGSTWSIALRGRKDTVAIASAIQMIDLGVVCPDVRIDTMVTITNTGSITTSVRGSVVGSFSLPLTQWRVDSGAVVAIPVRFSGQHDDGEYTGAYTFVDTTCGTSVTIAARVRVESATVVADAMAIRGEIGSSVDTTIELRNPSNRDVTVTSGVVGNGEFEIDATSLPITIPAGGSRVLTVRYRPTSGSVTTTLEMSGEPCNVSLSIPLLGTADDAPGIATVVLPDVSASAGEVVDVPVVLRNKIGRIGSEGATIQATLRFNATLLAPVEPTTLGRIVGNDRLLELTLPMTPIHDSTLAVIRLQALLGNDTITSLQLDSARVSEGVGTIDAVAGQFTLTGICRSGGPRLYNPDGQIVLRVIAPNPIRDEGAIEYELSEEGHVRLYIVDVLGRVVATLVDGDSRPGATAVVFDASGVSSGTYRCVLVTPTYVTSRQLVVSK